MSDTTQSDYERGRVAGFREGVQKAAMEVALRADRHIALAGGNDARADIVNAVTEIRAAILALAEHPPTA